MTILLMRILILKATTADLLIVITSHLNMTLSFSKNTREKFIFLLAFMALLHDTGMYFVEISFI